MATYVEGLINRINIRRSNWRFSLVSNPKRFLSYFVTWFWRVAQNCNLPSIPKKGWVYPIGNYYRIYIGRCGNDPISNAKKSKQQNGFSLWSCQGLGIINSDTSFLGSFVDNEWVRCQCLQNFQYHASKKRIPPR